MKINHGHIASDEPVLSSDCTEPLAPWEEAPGDDHRQNRSGPGTGNGGTTAPPEVWPPGLSDAHIAILKKSAIAPAVACARGYESVNDKTKLRILCGFTDKQARPGMLIPIRDVHGKIVLHQLRLDDPIVMSDEKIIRYLTPKGHGLRLDVPPAALEPVKDPAVQLWITEGAKKVDSAVSKGLCCIGLLGVSAFRGKNAYGGVTALSDWEHIALKGEAGARRVYVAFDSDINTKKQVRKSLERLLKFLQDGGADVMIIAIPTLPGLEKTGIDDYLASGGTVEKLLETATRKLPDLEEEDEVPTDPAAIAEEIIAKHTFAIDPGELLYAWDGTVYIPEGLRLVRQCVKEYFKENGVAAAWTSNKAKEVAEYINVDSRELWERPPIDRVSLLNGLLDVDARKLKVPIASEFLSPVQLPVEFDPKAPCPAWEKFVSEVFPGDSHCLAWELAGWLMIPFTGIQKAVMLVGEGGNGKSRFLAGLSAFLGRRNVSNCSLQRLETNRFSVATLVGKLANICPDLPSEHLASTNTFKAITGGDSVQGERKLGVSHLSDAPKLRGRGLPAKHGAMERPAQVLHRLVDLEEVLAAVVRAESIVLRFEPP